MAYELTLQAEISQLADQIFGKDRKNRANFVSWLVDTCAKAEGKDFILIHNPGGWGCTPLADCLEWERSIVEGISASLERLGYSYLLTQYFRSGRGWKSHMRNFKDEAVFFAKGKSNRAKVMAAELNFITSHLNALKIIMVGVSQGAAFSNAVMRQLGELRQVFSIELGIFFAHVNRRVVTDRTLAIDSNGVVPDPMVHRDLWIGFKAYITAPFRWAKYRLQGRPEKFTYCINAPGHDYNWKYPKVQHQIQEFLERNFGNKKET
jgi:hypothetical protein